MQAASLLAAHAKRERREMRERKRKREGWAPGAD